MAQFLDHRPDGTFMVYHTVPALEGTPEFEHKSYIDVRKLKHAKKHDGSDDPEVLEVPCPVPGCGTMCYVNLCGDAEAQRTHAHYREHKEKRPDAVQSVIDDVIARGHEPRLHQDQGG